MTPLELAKSSGFNRIERVGTWKKRAIYEAIVGDETARVGLPIFIIADKGGSRFTINHDETFEIMDNMI